MWFSPLIPLAALFSIGWTDENHKVVCYYGSWSTYRTGNGKFTSEDIDPSLCTHVVYAYTGLGPDYGIVVLDTWLSLDNGLGDFRKFTNMKRYNKDIKLLVGIGGFNEGPQKFSRMANNPGLRTFFIGTVVKFLELYGFDGISIDWMYPGSESAGIGEKENYVALLKGLREAFAPRNWVLAIAGSGNEYTVERGFDVRGISQYVDFVSLLSFDYHGSWESLTGHNSPLYPRNDETADSRKANQEYSVNLWLRKGMDAKKLILGVPTYGRSFTLQFNDRASVGAPSIAPGAAGRYTGTAGTLGFNELVEYFKEDGSWTTSFDSQQDVFYAYRGNFWISFDNPHSAYIKGKYAADLGLGGAMIFSLETDDFLGVNTVANGTKFPLVKGVKEGLKAGVSGMITTPRYPVTGDEVITGPWVPPTRDPNASTGVPVTWVQPTNQPLPNNDICQAAGSVKDPETCARYYDCVDIGGGKFQGILRNCPADLGYDESIKTCNYKDQIPGCH